MLSCAICDDDGALLEAAAAIVRSFNVARDGEPVRVETYLSSRQLCEDVEGGKQFDIFLLDVEMPQPDGFQAAERVRAALPWAAVAFLTSHTEFSAVRESFKAGALRYVSKLDMETALPEALEAALAACAKGPERCLALTWYNNVLRVPYSDILYARRASRTLEIVTESRGILRERKSLQELLEALDDPRFVQTDRGTLVNLGHVMEVSGTGLRLKNGEELSVSRKLFPQVKAAILDIWGGGAL